MDWQSIILPHVWFATMFQKYPHAFKQRVCPSRAKLLAFWNEMEDHPQMNGHPMRDRPNWRSCCIPLSIHGDGVPVTGCGKSWAKTWDIFSWMSLLGSGSTTEFNFLIWGIWSQMRARNTAVPTIKTFWKIVCWSLRVMYIGRWPFFDWEGRPMTNPIDVARAGTPLAGTETHFFFCVLWILKGDLEYLWKELGLPNCGSNMPCCYCPANTTTYPMYEFRIDRATWYPLVYSGAEWMETAWSQHELFHDVHDGITIHTVCADLMHTKHLGVDQYFFGSVLWLLTFRILPQSPSENLGTVFLEIQAAYTAYGTGCRYAHMCLSMFCDGGDPPTRFPCLKGRAAECRHLGKALLRVWVAHMDNRHARHVQIRMALELSVEAEEILDAHPRDVRLPRVVGARMKECLLNYLILFNALGKYYTSAEGQGIQLFDVTVKAHYLAHIALMCVYINPRLGWCYAGEDMMQHAKRLFSACTRGTKPHKISGKFFSNI